MSESNSPETPPAKILFADIWADAPEMEKTLPSKFKRMLEKLDLKSKVGKKGVGIKMHFGGSLGYSTIHPIFIRILVEALKAAGAKTIKIMDGDPKAGIPRGYTREIVECDIVSCFGASRKYLYREEIGFKTVDFVEYGGEAVDCDFFIDLSHVKGHGACGFGGALKNIAMGTVPGPSRRKLHSLEGGLTVDKDKCILCKKCIKACENNAIGEDEANKKVKFFFHDCTYCQHCLMVCPEKAIQMENRKFEDFAQGMALVTAHFLKRYSRENLLFINFLTNITIYCDCWGMTTANLVPDIGILASDDIIAIETASLDMIKNENLLRNGVPKNRKLQENDRHLFERIHGKDPYLMIQYLQKYYGGSSKYEMAEVK